MSLALNNVHETVFLIDEQARFHYVNDEACRVLEYPREDLLTLCVCDINAGLESTLSIAWNELKYKAKVSREFGDIPQIFCNLGQLNQVFLNLLINAAQAIEEQGEVRVSTRRENQSVVIEIADSGSGIPPERLGRIFEPFYTSKEIGKGTGLGLSIAYDITKKHEGDIRVISGGAWEYLHNPSAGPSLRKPLGHALPVVSVQTACLWRKFLLVNMMKIC